MAIVYKQSRALFKDTVSVEEAEALLNWLQKKANAKIDLSECTHLHPADLQVLMAAKVKVVAWPSDAMLANWLRPVLSF